MPEKQEAAHAPAPWAVERENWCGHPNCTEGHATILLVDRNGLAVARCDADGRERAGQVETDFGRIAACVNALEGLTTEALGASNACRVAPDLLRAAVALSHLVRSLTACPGATPELVAEVLSFADAAVALARGGRP